MDRACNRAKFKNRLLKKAPLREELDKANKIVLFYQKGRFKTKTWDAIRDDESLILIKATRL